MTTVEAFIAGVVVGFILSMASVVIDEWRKK